MLSSVKHRAARAGGSASAYPELSALVGPVVPDLRGLFLRGQGGNSAALGTKQGDAIRNFAGSFGATLQGYSDGGLFFTTYRYGGGYTGGDEVFGGIGFDVSRIVPTANENRPVNQAVRYLMRARP